MILANEHNHASNLKESKKSTASHPTQQNGNVFQLPEAKPSSFW